MVRGGSASSGTGSDERHPDALELSMGMSLDYQVAVEEGATMVRIGTALFGRRGAPLGRRREERSEMAGVWKKTLNYLGLVEEDEEFVDELPDAEPAPVRRMRPQAVRDVPADAEGVVRTIAVATARRRRRLDDPQVRAEAVQRGSRGRRPVQGAATAVIMNLQGTEDAIARRLVDFASGLVYGLDGKIELVANRVYLLSPAERRGLRRGARAARRRRVLQPVLSPAPSGSRRRVGCRLLAFPPMARCARTPSRA